SRRVVRRRSPRGGSEQQQQETSLKFASFALRVVENARSVIAADGNAIERRLQLGGWRSSCLATRTPLSAPRVRMSWHCRRTGARRARTLCPAVLRGAGR